MGGVNAKMGGVKKRKEIKKKRKGLAAPKRHQPIRNLASYPS
jgi:hypothetical protein